MENKIMKYASIDTCQTQCNFFFKVAAKFLEKEHKNNYGSWLRLGRWLFWDVT